MPEYLHEFEIDWGWPGLSETERAIARRHEARAQADPGTHTVDTLTAALAQASRELRGRDIRARAEDAHRAYVFVARDGRCSPGDRFNPDGKFPELLSAEDYRAAGVETLYVSLYWPEAMLREMQKEAARLDRSLSWLVQKAWLLAKSSTAAPMASRAHELPRDGSKRKQSIYLPIETYSEVREVAAREDHSMSFVVQRALGAAWSTIAALAPEQR